MNESCHIHRSTTQIMQWQLRTRRSWVRVSHMNESCHIYRSTMQIMQRQLRTRRSWVTGLILRDPPVPVTNGACRRWHDSFMYVTWRIHICDTTHSYMIHDAFIYVTWRIHICDMTHSYMWHDPFIYVTWPMHVAGSTCCCNKCSVQQVPRLMCTWHASVLHVTWLIRTWYMRHDSFTLMSHGAPCAGRSRRSRTISYLRHVPFVNATTCGLTTLAPSWNPTSSWNQLVRETQLVWLEYIPHM